MRTNEPAFPVLDSMGDGTTGMSLRDYFAGQALTGMFASGKEIQSDGVKISSTRLFAKLAYNVADSMLKEREKPIPPEVEDDN